MDIAVRKLNFVQRFLKLSDEKTIDKLERLLYSEIKSSAQLSPMDIEEFNAMIDQSENDHKNSDVIEAKDILKQIDKW
ncbi:MAG: hypothetical protein PF694_07845 [Bacteroidetes bacterium]|jgi:hypothetical protein|nr:hypothetical protein [Bacteroidota bacterium]